MSNYIVTRKSDGAEMTRYSAAAPTVASGYNLTDYDHTEFSPDDPVVQAAPVWRIYVGAFFDRFGAAKIGILADPDAVVQALIKDISVRKYVALTERHDELALALGVIASKGHAIDPVAILDLEPTADEVWNG